MSRKTLINNDKLRIKALFAVENKKRNVKRETERNREISRDLKRNRGIFRFYIKNGLTNLPCMVII